MLKWHAPGILQCRHNNLNEGVKMNSNMRTPPPRTGYFKGDIAKIYDWCLTLKKQLTALMSRIEDNQIVSLSPSKLKGELNFDNITMPDGVKISVENGKLIITASNNFKIQNSAGTQYIEFSGDNLNIKGNILS